MGEGNGGEQNVPEHYTREKWVYGQAEEEEEDEEGLVG